MGALGSDAAIEAADVVLMDDDPLKVVKAVRIAKKCMRIVYQNIYFAIGIQDSVPASGRSGNCKYVACYFCRCRRYGNCSSECHPRAVCKKIIIPVQKIPACDMIKKKGREITWQKQKRVCAVIQRKFMKSF